MTFPAGSIVKENKSSCLMILVLESRSPDKSEVRGAGMFQARVVLLVLMCLSVCYGQQAANNSQSQPGVNKGTGVRKGDAVTTCDTTSVPYPGSNFPKGFDYPQQVQNWVTPGMGGRVRLHAWCLFAGLNLQAKPNGPLLWQTWKTTTQAFPYQYNPWKGGVGGQEQPLPKGRPAPLNARNQANATVGAGLINNPAPKYPINRAVADNPKYQSCKESMGVKGHDDWFQLKDGAHIQSNGDIMIAGVIYSDAAIHWILSNNLYNANTLTKMLPPTATSPPTAITPMPVASIALKPMFWPVKKGGFTVLPVWDWDANKPGSPSDNKYAGYEMQSMWRNAVAITDLVNPTPPPTITYLHGVGENDATTKLGPITYNNTTQISPPAFRVVSVNDFYHRQMNQSDLDQLDNCDRAILDASAYWAYDRAFQPGDYLVLIAMHIMTKEQPDWAFQSLWYQPDADKNDTCRYCQNRPTNLKDQTFRHYLLTTTYGTTQQTPADQHPNSYRPPNTLLGAKLWPVAYNPYIELAASHPITPNCMNCHHRAAWPSFLRPEIENRTSSYLPDSPPNPPNPNVLEVYPPNAQPLFNGLTTLDAMWAVSDRAGYPLGPTKKSSTKKKPPSK